MGICRVNPAHGDVGGLRMARVIKTLAADVVRFNLGGLVAVAVALVDLVSGQHLGAPVDTTLLVTGLAALGLHVADNVGAVADASSIQK